MLAPLRNDALKLPRPFGQYTLLKRLAVGGMAEIYLAKTGSLGGFEKLVALKLIHPEFAQDEHFIQMLIEEAKISVFLNHVNIVQTFDLGLHDDTYYIVMEYIDGADAYRVKLKAKKEKKRLPPEFVAHIGAEVCNGLAFAHTRKDEEGNPLNIVHRDISPHNILISNAGDVKLLDFGIAKAEVRREKTQAGVIKGKYHYMSPEQAWGDPMDFRSDLFSVGIVLYELLTGQMVYDDAPVPELLDNVRRAEIRMIREVRPDVPEALEKLIHKALRPEPEDRFDSAAEMSARLTAFVRRLRPNYTTANVVEVMAQLYPDVVAEPQSGFTRLGSMSSEETTNSAALPLPMMDRDSYEVGGNSIIRDLDSSALRALSTEDELALAALEDTDQGAPVRHPGTAPLHNRGGGRGGGRGAGRDRGRSKGALHSEPTRVGKRNPLQDPGGPLDTDADSFGDRSTDERASPFGGRNPAWEDSTKIQLEEGPRRAPRLSGDFLPPDSDAQITTPNPRAALERGGAPLDSVPPPVAPPPSGVGHLAAHPPGQMGGPISATGQVYPPPAQARPGGRSIPAHLVLALIGASALVLGLMVLIVYLAIPHDPEAELAILSSPAGAEVLIDGRRLPGVTPLTIRGGLEAGRVYALEIRHAGYQSTIFNVEARPGVQRRAVVLESQQVVLRIASDPPGAQVWVDGSYRGEAPVPIQGLSAGQRIRLRLSLPGAGELNREYTVPANQANPELRITMQSP